MTVDLFDSLGDEPRKKKLLIIAAIVSIAVVLIFVLVALRSTNSVDKLPGSCKIVDKAKRIDLQHIKPIPSEDNTALVRFVGYLAKGSSKSDSEHYYELEPRGMMYSKLSNSKIEVHIDTDCADLEISIFREERAYRFEKMTVAPRFSGAESHACESKINSVWFKHDTHYACGLVEWYECKGLDVNSTRSLGYELELEIEGEPEKIKMGHFSKPAVYCS